MQLATRWTAFLPHTMQPDSLNWFSVLLRVLSG